MKHDMTFHICPDSEFFGKQREIDTICHWATEAQKLSIGMLIVGKRWTGKTEILRRVHQWLFWNQARAIPVYYQFKTCAYHEDFAEDYVKEIIKQYLAFIKRDVQVIRTEVALERLEGLCRDIDIPNISGLITRYREAKGNGDFLAALRNAITMPYTLSLHSNIPIFLILDDIDCARKIVLSWNGVSMMREFFNSLYPKYPNPVPFLMASSIKSVLDDRGLSGAMEIIKLDGLEEEIAVPMTIELCRQYNIEFDTGVLAFITKKLSGNPVYIKNIVWAAYRAGRDFINLRDFIDLYLYELTEGNLGFLLFSAIPIESLSDLRVLHTCMNSRNSISEEEIREKVRCSTEEIKKAVGSLVASGLLEKDIGLIRWGGDDVVKDFIHCLYETRIKGKSTEEVRTGIARKDLKEGFYQKGIKVEGRIKEETIEIIEAFHGQKIVKALLNNQIFSAGYEKGVFHIPENMRAEDVVTLPQIIGCFDALKWEKETEPTIIIAYGFQNNRYDTAHEEVWIVGIKEDMVPVNPDEGENFIRRSSILKEIFRANKVARWFVGSEGFHAEAQKRLDSEGIYSTDAVQLRILKDRIMEEKAADRSSGIDVIAPNKEFEVVLPMGSKAELVAVKVLEGICMEMGFDEDAISQIKVALVEACINAFEHCKVKEGKICLRFIAGRDRLVIHVQNKGMNLDQLPSMDRIAFSETRHGLPHKKGWGIELIRGFMDEVCLETLKSGTEIVMTKYLAKKGDIRNDQRTEKF